MWATGGCCSMLQNLITAWFIYTLAKSKFTTMKAHPAMWPGDGWLGMLCFPQWTHSLSPPLLPRALSGWSCSPFRKFLLWAARGQFPAVLGRGQIHCAHSAECGGLQQGHSSVIARTLQIKTSLLRYLTSNYFYFKCFFKFLFLIQLWLNPKDWFSKINF